MSRAKDAIDAAGADERVIASREAYPGPEDAESDRPDEEVLADDPRGDDDDA